MSVLHAADPATVWMHNGMPVRLVWRGIRYKVTDTPTRFSELLFGLTHLPAIDGWRFQGTSGSGESRVFDVKQTGGAEWEVLRVYD